MSCLIFEFLYQSATIHVQGLSPERRKVIYQATAKTLASLHKVDVDSIGLQKFGRRDNYCKRQVMSFGWFK